jgi:triphosphatase
MTIETTDRPSSGDAASEIELKLEIDQAAMDRLTTAEILRNTTPKVIHQVSAYFDTPKQDLRAAGVSLRVRTAAGKHVQTIKVSGGAAAGLFARPEWEHEVAGFEPEIETGSPIHVLIGFHRHDNAQAVGRRA